MTVRTLTIGELAQAAKTNVELIRYYERIGLLLLPPRTPSGRRVYPPETANRLGFIRRARELGFALDDVRALLDLAENPQAPCEEVSALARRHLAEVNRKVADLERLRASLNGLIDQCAMNAVDDCPIIEALIGSPTE